MNIYLERKKTFIKFYENGKKIEIVAIYIEIQLGYEETILCRSQIACQKILRTNWIKFWKA